MKIRNLSLFVAFLGLFCPVFAQKVGLRSSKLDVQHLALDIRFDWPQKQALGRVRIQLALLEAGENVRLDAAFMAIDSVKMGRVHLPFEYAGGDTDNNLNIFTQKKCRAGEAITLDIWYRTLWVNATDPNNIAGSTGKGLRFLEPSSTEPKRRRQIWSMGEGQGNRYWFPCHDHPNDLRTTEINITTAQPFTAIASGKLVRKSRRDNGDITYHYRSERAYPNHKTAIAVGEYGDAKRQLGRLTLHNFAPTDELEATAATVDQLSNMLRFFESETGQKFPYPAYSQVFVQEIPWGGGSGGMAIQTENMIDDHPTHADYLYLWDMLEGESLANQWFGNFVAPRTWGHYWLDKAFSRYFSCLFDEHHNSRAEFLLFQLPYDQGLYFGDWGAGIRQPVVLDEVADLNAFVNGNYANARGALVLNMLREHLGDETWRKAIRQYVKKNAGKTAITSDFQAAVEGASGEKLDWFFDQWLYKMGHPVFEVQKHYDAEKKQLILTVKQLQQLDSASTYQQQAFFQGKIKVEVDNRIETLWLKPQAKNEFAIVCSANPRVFNFDFEKNWIAEIRMEKTQTDYVNEVKYSRDILAKRAAILALANIASDSGTDAETKAMIQKTLFEVVNSKAYWRIRNTALASLPSTYGPAPLRLDQATVEQIQHIIQHNDSWVRNTAIQFLGQTCDPKFADLYLSYLQDKSERVVNAAAIALGKSKSPKAFEALIALKDKPSWKNQSLISALYGLKELGDARAIDFALRYLNASDLPHWTLSVPVWDHRLAAAHALVALGAADRAYPIIHADLEKAIAADHVNDIFYNLLQISILKDKRGQNDFDKLSEKYKNNAEALRAVKALETQFKEGY